MKYYSWSRFYTIKKATVTGPIGKVETLTIPVKTSIIRNTSGWLAYDVGMKITSDCQFILDKTLVTINKPQL